MIELRRGCPNGVPDLADRYNIIVRYPTSIYGVNDNFASKCRLEADERSLEAAALNCSVHGLGQGGSQMLDEWLKEHTRGIDGQDDDLLSTLC